MNTRQLIPWNYGDANLIERRFWDRVDTTSDGCWLYPGSPKKKYAQTSLGSRESKQVLCHRLSWEISNRCAIPEGMWVLHRCDTPKCVRPSHLFLGTALDNSQDMVAKGRSTAGRSWASQNPELLLRGERHPNSILTSEQVLEVRRLHMSGESMYQLAKLFSVSDVSISNIIKRKTWKHL